MSCFSSLPFWEMTVGDPSSFFTSHCLFLLHQKKKKKKNLFASRQCKYQLKHWNTCMPDTYSCPLPCLLLTRHLCCTPHAPVCMLQVSRLLVLLFPLLLYSSPYHPPQPKEGNFSTMHSSPAKMLYSITQSNDFPNSLTVQSPHHSTVGLQGSIKSEPSSKQEIQTFIRLKTGLILYYRTPSLHFHKLLCLNNSITADFFISSSWLCKNQEQIKHSRKSSTLRFLTLFQKCQKIGQEG